ncbi:MAG: FHA domain-containing protein [Dehalococcoidia bacterium]|nr:FHA domain-containing protein [Dehalococcoidia bacterium]
MLVCGIVAILFCIVSLVGIYFSLWAFEATILSLLVGLIRHRVWRAICAGFAIPSFLFLGFFSFFVGLLTTFVFGLGLLLLVGSIAAIAGTVFAIVELVNTINGDDPAGARGGYGAAGAWGQPAQQIIINNNNSAQNSAQVGNNDNRRVTYPAGSQGSGARVGVIDCGRPLPDLPIRAGQALLAGRDAAASVRLSDPRASRRHVEIMLDGNGWIVRDLGSVNPTRILSPYGEQEVAGTVRRVSHGQLAIGNSIITLYPPGS